MRDLDDYILAHIDAEPEHLHRLWRATNLELLNGRMASGHLQGRLLKMLVTMVKPRNILEVGTFSGYSALCMAEGLADDDCRVYTFEVNDEVEDFTRRWIETSPVGHRVSFAVGDALQLAPALGITFDMAFLDGDKRTYVEAYEMALTVVRSGGFIIADNTLWDGHVIDSAYDHDHQTQGIRRFNDHVASDARIEKIIIPIRDGLTIMKKK
ncbi:MAG: O-methyltransferase [Prevotella sp.]|nr:O-methyltransferase [Prevotella sp.]